MAVVHTECLCPADSKPQALAKIANNLSALFYLMSEGSYIGQTVNLGNCLCSEPQILAAINANLVGFFNWWSENGGASSVVSGSVDLDTNDTSKAVTFPEPFDVEPVVFCIVVSPDSSGFVISASPDDSTVSTTGFTALLAVAIPGAGYKLFWFASEPTI